MMGADGQLSGANVECICDVESNRSIRDSSLESLSSYIFCSHSNPDYIL